MKFVILSNKMIPGFNGVKGPVMSPMEYDIHLVLKWINARIDVREVMEDGSYRKLSCNDARLMEELNKKHVKHVEALQNKPKPEIVEIKPVGNIRLKPEKKPNPVVKQKPVKKEEPKKQEVQEEVKDDVMLLIDDLEKPE